MPRDLSRSPSRSLSPVPRDFSRSPSPSRSLSPVPRRRRSPSPVGHGYIRKSWRDRSQNRSPYSSYTRSRQGSRSISPRRLKGRSPTPKRRRSRSPTSRHCRKQRSKSPSLSSTGKSLSTRPMLVQRKIVCENLRKEEEKKKHNYEELTRNEEAAPPDDMGSHADAGVPRYHRCLYKGIDDNEVNDLTIDSAGRLQKSQKVSRWSTIVCTTSVDLTAWKFKHASEAQKRRWFAAWTRHFRWDRSEALDEIIYVKWKLVASKRYNDIIGKARTAGTRVPWVDAETWARWMKLWDKDPEASAASARNSANRTSNPSLHSGGSISHAEHLQRMREREGREVSAFEFFTHMHTRGHDGHTFIDDRSKEIAERTTKLIRQREAENGSKSSVAEQNNAFLEVVGGVGPGGRVLGVGTASSAIFGEQVNQRRGAAHQAGIARANADLRSQVASLQTQMSDMARLQQQRMEEMRAEMRELISQIGSNNAASSHPRSSHPPS